MSLEVVTPQAAIEQYVQDKVDEFTEFLTRQLCYIGEAALKAAREKGSFKNYVDRSGNLRNSTGYVVAIGGKVVPPQDSTSPKAYPLQGNWRPLPMPTAYW